MKRTLLLALVTCLLAGQASADMFTLSVDQATSLEYVSHAPADASSTFGGVYTDPWEYDPVFGKMHFSVGYVGTMYTTKGYTGGPLSSVGWSEMLLADDVSLDLSSYGGYRLSFANDNDDLWYTRLYMVTGSGVHWSGWTLISPDTQGTLTLDFTGIGDLEGVTGIGFAVGGYLTNANGNPSNSDAFHISAVPTPVAVLLGMLGMGVAGLKLRKLV